MSSENSADYNLSKRSFLKVLLFVLTPIFIASFVGVLLIIYVSIDLPSVDVLHNYEPALPTEIISEDGEVLLSVGREKRDLVEFHEIPSTVVNAFLAAEDANFYEHRGIDLFGIFRALVADIKAGKIVQGGSTITQQVAKILLLYNEKSILRKIKDVILAIQIEQKFSKEEILYLYLNHVYLGGGYYGIKSAFRGYFDKDLSEATPAESALVAGLLAAPGRYSPYNQSKSARTRQLYVLKQMYEKEMITKEQYVEAKEKPIMIRIRRSHEMKAGHFTDWIRQRLIGEVGEDKFLTSGYRVLTTLNWKLQKQAEEELLKGLRTIDERQGYGGPLKQLKTNEEIEKFVWQKRDELLHVNSHYFLLDESGEKMYEHSLQRHQAPKKNYINKQKHLVEGHYGDHFILSFLEKNQLHEVVVREVNDELGLVFFDLAGIPGFIPAQYFKWAKKRSYNENYYVGGTLTRPSSMIKAGDVVQIELIEKEAKLARYLSRDKTKQLVSSVRDSSPYQQSSYLVGILRQPLEIEGAVLVIENKTGKILSMVGGKDFQISQFNRAIQSMRQTGSAFKPFVYASALEKGFKLSDIIMDSPEAMVGMEGGPSWRPKNYDNKFMGPLTFRKSFELSRNIPTIKLASIVGISEIKSFVGRFFPSMNIEDDLTMALGSSSTTLFEMTNAYSLFFALGKYRPMQSVMEVKDRYLESIPSTLLDSKIISQINLEEMDEENPFLRNLSENQIYDERLAYLMVQLFKGSIQEGTGKAARDLSLSIGGKTGTTSSYIDAWYIGGNGKVTVGVWTGMDDNKTMGFGETGSRSALPIWKGIMKSAIDIWGDKDVSMPQGIINVLVDRETGRPVTQPVELSFLESFVQETYAKNSSYLLHPTDSEAPSNLIEEEDYYRAQ